MFGLEFHLSAGLATAFSKKRRADFVSLRQISTSCTYALVNEHDLICP